MLRPRDPPPPGQWVNGGWGGNGVGFPPRKATLPGRKDKTGPPWPAGTQNDLAMGSPSDPENPDRFSQAPVRTCRVLDWVLGTALLLLLAGVVAAYTALRTNSAQPPASQGLSAPGFRAQGPYAQLVMKDIVVKNMTLNWHSDSRLSGVFLAPQMNYDVNKRELEVGVAGLYFIYAHLKLQQVVVPAYSQGTIEVSVSGVQGFGPRPLLTLSLELGPYSTSTTTTSESSLIFLNPGDRLRLNMSTTAGDFLDWLGASTFGLFWVAGGQQLTEPGTYLL
ncbi:LOW QUALITY PROTEIN: tumor necrosis factor ligand superfamily member 9 [Dromiciops gliroides]|uniref:LOW QUALITY PROTEIN: tumor necrosis factor ligand superfamily member 9 n=1 Tax=Dromiciops gliroides TaxID=33562 RepID=UPI001CC54308|nr:LOW QUALITY PROTEIN: tumor necrosis factor ligand superfamily member 9 [Dromiciops gliroides]